MIAHDRIVLGASAGGVFALQETIAGLPANLPAAVFITLHMFSRSEALLPELLSASCPLKASHAREGERIENGRIYVAPPDYHLLFSHDALHLSHGPKEGLQRPSINVMFRSAATVFGERVTGVVLTGMLDDGAAGLWDILQHGGATIVQDPEEAAYRSMPDSAVRGLNVQYILRLREMATTLARLSMGERRQMQTQSEMPGSVPESKDFPLVEQACPECGGAMRLKQVGGLKEFSCHVGHRLGLQTMITDKTNVVERTMWKALSQSEELVDLLEEAQRDANSSSLATPSEFGSLRAEIDSRRRDTEILRSVLERRRLDAARESR